MPVMHCLARIRPLHKATGTRIDIHISSASLREITGLNGVVWEPAMVSAPVLNMRLFNGDFQAAVEPGSASLPINMTALKQSYPTADACAWSAAQVDIWAGEAGQAWPWTQVFSGKVSGWNRRGQVLSLSAETAFDDKNVLMATYAGTGGAEGSLDLKGKVKPLALGWPQNVEPVLISAVDSVYQFSAYGPIEAVTKLYERGSDFGASIGDYADYAALVAASIPPGRWATCLTQGMIRLGAPAFGVITGDLKGHKVGASAPRLTGAIINALATISGTSSAFIESASLAALDGAAPYPVSVMVTDQAKFSDVAKGLAMPCNWQAGISLLGKFFVMPITLAGSPALTLDSRGRSLPQVIESAEQDVSPPYFKTILGAAQSWRVHTADEIAFNAALISRGDYSAGETYREGNIVRSADGSAWLYINPVASSGNAPPTWPTTSNAYWENHTPPLSAAALTYGDGTPIESLKPAQGGATAGATSGVDLRNNAGTAILQDGDIITSSGTAAAIAGQGPGATATAGAVMNYAVQVGQNAIINSDFVRGLAGYSTGWTNIPNAQKVDGLNLPGWHGAINLAYTTLQGTPSAGVFDALRPYANTEASFLGSLNRYTMPVVDGDRVFASALVAIHRNSAPADVKVIWFDGGGNYLTDSTVGSGGTDQGGANGDPATLERVGGFANAPANARWASIIIRGFVDGTKADPYLFYGQMMLSKVPAGQTAWPPYMPGPADRRADTTFENTAAAISGQGYFATQNYADWGSRITGAGKPQDNATVGARVGVNLRNNADTAYLGDVDVLTAAGTAAAIAGQGYLATQNYAGVSRLLLAGYDNIIPDADYRDPVWWGFSSLPNVSFITGDSYWEQERILKFVCDRDFDFYSTMFAVEPNSTYRVRARIWNNGGSWSGAFWPLIYMPNVAWWSLKHGTGVDDNVANAANAIVANGDTGYQDLYFRVSANSMRKIQFWFKSTARGSDVLIQVAISKVPQLGKDLIKSGTATKYLVAEIETGQGIAAAIAGQGAGATANNLAQLDPTAAGQLTTAYNGGVQSAAYGETIKRKIGAGGTLALSAIVNCAAGGVSGSITCVIQSRPYGGSWSNVATGSGSSTGPSEPGGDDASGTFTNSTGIEQVFEFRVVESRTPSGAGGSILASQSYVTG